MMLFKAFALVSTFAFAAPQVSKIEADFVCAVGATSQYSFNMTVGKERVWMSAPNATDGIPLKVVEILRAKCPGCYSVKADWDNGAFVFTLSGNAQTGTNSITVDATGNSEEGETQTLTSTGTCKRAK